MSEVELNQVAYTDFIVTDSNGDIVTGLVDADFTKYLYNPSGSEVWSSQGGSITELGNGAYRITFTPNATGDWIINVVHTTYFPAGKSENFRCTDIETSIDNIQSDLDNPAQYKADVSSLALESTAQAIKSKTDNLPSDPSSQSQVETAITLSETNIRGADSDTLKTISDQLDAAQTNVDELLDIEEGKWEIVNNQMIFYRRNGTELMRFNLYDASNNPTMTKVYKRVKV